MERNLSRQPTRRSLSVFVYTSVISAVLTSCSYVKTELFPHKDYGTTYHRGCVLARLWHACPTVPITGVPGTIHDEVGPFHSIYVAGPYNVGVRTDRGAGRDVLVHGDVSVIGRTRVYVKDTVLYVKAEDGFAYSHNNLASIDIRMSVLNKIYFDSPGKLLAKGVHTTQLMVIAKDNARVILKGQVRNLNVITSEHARVDTHDLQVKKTISAVASGDSRLYHTNQPVSRNAYPIPTGAVIRMGGLKLEASCPKPPCREAVKQDLFTEASEK
jgi:hypothetical protein